MKFLFSFLLSVLFIPLHAVHIDRWTENYEVREKKHRIDTYDFSGIFPQLENIDIDARKKKNVEFYLTGQYPNLETINYEGCFGALKGKLTGIFPKLILANFLCSNAKIDFDLTGEWEQSCDITFTGMKENVVLKLPENIGVIVHTRTKPSGKVIASNLKKKGRGIWKKTYVNPLADTSPVVLNIHVEVTDGTIILK